MRAWLSFVLVVLAAALVGVDRYWVPLTPLRTAGSLVYGTAERALGSVARLWTGTDRVDALERENAGLRASLLTASAPVTTGKVAGIAAHVVGFGQGQSLTIDAGAAQGVTRDVTVVNADGLVGKVTWAGPSSATVALITDASSSVGARVAGSGELGLVNGMPGQGRLRLRLFSPDAPVKAGDRVVTLGSEGGRPYRAGVLIGSVVEVSSDPAGAVLEAVVRPAARVSALDLVTVVG
ncbi:rod shape-determining protein MreC [Nonomuraea sp. NPDC050536]|uniref:rod shape-determining protein MreC n=1 Tax=Nonomuraea sp. NPDC050536 TaxID=3364366 RepID=UPI0037C534FB